MYLYRNVIELLIDKGIKYFILIGENILNFHADTNDYYEEWSNNIGDGWIIGINFRSFVISEFSEVNIDYFIAFSGEFNDVQWRKIMPDQLFEKLTLTFNNRLGI